MFDEGCPNKTVKIKKLDIKKLYITSEIKKLIRDKHRLQRLYNKKPIMHGIEYRKLRNKLNKIIRNAKSNYFKSKLGNNSNNMKFGVSYVIYWAMTVKHSCQIHFVLMEL